MVGAGPAGLSCAYFLALMGRPSVVFEAQPVPGGMLALGIPEYRLPKTHPARGHRLHPAPRRGAAHGTPVKDVADDLLKDRASGRSSGHRARRSAAALGIEGEDLTACRIRWPSCARGRSGCSRLRQSAWP